MHDSTEKIACLTLDLEQDYGRISAYNCFNHIDTLCEILIKHHIKISVFVVGNILDKGHDDVIKKLSHTGAEFSLHSYSHDLSSAKDFKNEVRLAKKAYENYFGKAPTGYRAPQGKITGEHFQVLQDEGFIFDSSIIPSWRPGIYSNLNAPTEPYKVGEIIEIPFSVIPKVRILSLIHI